MVVFNNCKIDVGLLCYELTGHKWQVQGICYSCEKRKNVNKTNVHVVLLDRLKILEILPTLRIIRNFLTGCVFILCLLLWQLLAMVTLPVELSLEKCSWCFSFLVPW